MRRARWIVAAALLGGALTSLTVAALALGAVDASDATVTLQVAPRGPGQRVRGADEPGRPDSVHRARRRERLRVDVRARDLRQAGREGRPGRRQELLRLERARVRHEHQLHRQARRRSDVGRRRLRAADARRQVLRRRRRRDRVLQPGGPAVRSGRGAGRRGLLSRIPAAHARRGDCDAGDDAVPRLERAGRLPVRADGRGHLHDHRRGSADLGGRALRQRAGSAARRPRSASSSSCARAATAAAA